jgi:hypothetical protein
MEKEKNQNSTCVAFFISQNMNCIQIGINGVM